MPLLPTHILNNYGVIQYSILLTWEYFYDLKIIGQLLHFEIPLLLINYTFSNSSYPYLIILQVTNYSF